MTIPTYRFEVAHCHNDANGDEVEDIYPIIYGARAEAEAKRQQLLAGADPSFFTVDAGGFLEVFELIVARDGSVSRTGA